MLRGVTSSAQIQANKPKTEGKGYILAIGIDNYQHCPKLQNAVRDVQNITRVLTHRYQFDSTNLTLLTNEQATHSTILEKLRRLQECVTSSDTVIIYFFGHGTYEDAINEGYWIPGGRRRSTSTYAHFQQHNCEARSGNPIAAHAADRRFLFCRIFFLHHQNCRYPGTFGRSSIPLGVHLREKQSRGR